MMPRCRRTRKRHRRLSRRRRWLAALGLLWLGPGALPARAQGPAPVAPAPAGVSAQAPPSPDAAAEAALTDGQARFARGDFAGARASFAAARGVAGANGALVSTAMLGEARAALALGDANAAIVLTEPLAAGVANDPTVARARFLLGVALVRGGQPARGRSLLQPFEQAPLPADEAAELHATLAAAAAATPGSHPADVEDALREYGLFWDAARPLERAFVRERARALAATLSDGDAQRIERSAAPGGLAQAVLAERLAAAAPTPEAARAILEAADPARRRYGLIDAPAAPPPTRSAIPGGAIGLVLPLSGKGRPLGDHALRGALLAGDDLPAGPGALDLRLRDSGSRPDRAAAAVEELAREGVVAIVGSPDRAEAAALAPRCQALGLPLLDLAPDDAREGGVFHLLRPTVVQAVALAGRAVGGGARRVATLYPDNAYGRRMAAAFGDTARVRGAEVAGEVRFEEHATTFTEPVKKLAALHADAVFVPATAGQLELIAAQLVAAGVTRAPAAHPKAPVATLYATADGIAPSVLVRAGRALQGAVVAPAFVFDDEEGGFGARYRAAYGEEPRAADALGFEAVRALRIALAPPATTAARAPLPERLGAERETGPGGLLGFGPEGERLGEPPLYVVDGERLAPLPPPPPAR